MRASTKWFAPRAVTAVLAALLICDVVLSLWGFFFPDLWFSVFHGAPRVDPEGFIRRCAANWLMFAALQAVALRRWRAAPVWLAVVAGARLGDALTDWSYLYFCAHVTPWGAVALLSAGPLNLAAGLYLLRASTSVRPADLTETPQR